MANEGNSNVITREYLDSLLIETRYMNSCVPDTGFVLYGREYSSPIMTGALSHLDGIMFPGASRALAEGAAAAGAVMWLGMADEAEVEDCVAAGADVIEIIKPYKDRDIIYSKMEHAKKIGLPAVGIDIDHPFSEDGSPDNVDGFEMKALTTSEMEQICKAAGLPVIAKGVLSLYDANEVLDAGVSGLLLSHHNNRIEYAIPALMLLPDVVKMVNGECPIFVDGEIKTGMDAFKALALGATAVGIGRPLMTAIKDNGADGVRDYLNNAAGQLAKAMAYTGCTDLGKMDPTVIHKK